MNRLSKIPSNRRFWLLAGITLCLGFNSALGQDAEAAARRLREARSFDALFAAPSVKARQSIVRVEINKKRVGYGIVTGSDGQVITKLSLIQGEVSCILPSKKRVKAHVVFQDQQNDLALLKLDTTNLKAAKLSPDIKLQVGQWIITPSQEKDGAHKVGVVGVLPRKILNASGFLGVTIEDGNGGALVRQVAAASAAEACGLQVDDIITRIGKSKISGRDELVEVVGALSPGDKVSLQILRDSREVSLTATLGKREEPQRTRGRSSRNRRFSRGFSKRKRGFDRAIQYDAILQPSECGGPVIDILGRVVGLNIARAERTRTLALTNDVLLAFLKDAKKATN